jgi:hypothetical protein
LILAFNYLLGPQKSKLLNEKLEIEQKIRDFEQKGNNWLEPMKEMILASSQAKILLSQSDNQQIRSFLKNVGSNFILKDKNSILRLKSAGEPSQRASQTFSFPTGGGGGIRTHAPINRGAVFKTASIGHSDTPPALDYSLITLQFPKSPTICQHCSEFS